MPSSVVRLVRLDHERLDRLLRRAAAEGPSQQRWRDELCALLQAHRTAEREELLPELVVRPGPLGSAARRLGAADVELDRLTARLGATSHGDPGWSDRLAGVAEALAVHADTMRTETMPLLEQVTARKELRRLGGAYESRRDRELGAGALRPPPPRRLDVSRAELYEMARRAGIEGRSGMSRDELIERLRRISGPTGRG
jgi:hypothetical protein